MKTTLVLSTLAVLLAAPAFADDDRDHDHDKNKSDRHHDVKSAAAIKDPLPTQKFRDEHKEVRVHLGHVSEWAGALTSRPAAEQRDSALEILGFFQKHIRPHAEWEEKKLYPLIDELTQTQKTPFTSTMRHEHRVVGRWIDELEAELKKPAPDYKAFARRTDNLLGLLWAHFEEEEEVLLPFVDRAMTAAQFNARMERGGEH